MPCARSPPSTSCRFVRKIFELQEKPENFQPGTRGDRRTRCRRTDKVAAERWFPPPGTVAVSVCSAGGGSWVGTMLGFATGHTFGWAKNGFPWQERH